MPRRLHDKAGAWGAVGDIGRLVTLDRYYNIAGETVGLVGRWNWRLSPLKLPLLYGAQVDVCAFHIPHRQIYGDNWINWVKGGLNETVTFPNASKGAAGDEVDGTMRVYPNLDEMACLAPGRLANNMPLHIPEGYRRIWGWYFRHPTDKSTTATQGELPVGTQWAGKFAGRGAELGVPCAHLPDITNTHVNNEIPSTARDATIDVTGASVDVVGIAQQQAIYRTELQRQFRAHRYRDVMKEVWDTGVSLDVDEKPRMLWSWTFTLGGYEVDGTDDATLGQVKSRGIETDDFRMPNVFLSEHGVVWLVAVVRFPTIYIDQCHYLDKVLDPTYLDMSGDADAVRMQPPETANHYRYNGTVGNSSTVNWGLVPFGEHYRHHTPRIHPRYKNIKEGLPYVRNFPNSQQSAWYVVPDEYDKLFAGNNLGTHWNMQAGIVWRSKSQIPGRLYQIFASAGL